ncbi:glycosyltransferase family 9 protein [Pigmentiphaga litoralis]|uniref:ADP-heptose:LPS heptosyltransferase n=1 Tax=Pigmentiphaga litoralis TaxID=516702 RepID=A0A7Y9IVW4_9BURK|nr:glycosyltransferase family 9 protein [Pigmentiphaga litoralis]NYE22364.1 ADP-heptose:LPS heptosyltransferase [Pigmentiphaga litoralis]NYE84021.1 ADP-heptose:LPS heptosyltransferase [Pigmentiphaga litoralis]
MTTSSLSWTTPPRRIAVFRALQLGDLLCTVPALRALRQAAPTAEITLVGLPEARGFVERYSDYLDDLLIFPGMDGMPEQMPRPHELPGFYAAAQARQFDLAIQLHGTGYQVNDIVDLLGAKVVAGFEPPEWTPRGPTFLAWPDDLPEPLRYTALMAHLGIPVRSTELDFPLTLEDQRECDAMARQLNLRPADTILVHPGARLLSRRWPVDRFAAVASWLAAEGHTVAVTGSRDERSLTRQLLDRVDAPLIDLTGLTSLGGLAALLAQCRLLVCNDTGVSHVAAAVGTPSVVIASGSDVARWAPLDRDLHPVLWHDMPCRPCAFHACPTDHECARGVAVDDVLAQVRRQLERQETSHA